MPRLTVLAASMVVALGCAGPTDEPGGAFPDLDEITEAASVVLEEPVAHPLGDVGHLVELADGFALSDALGPELRTYHPDGRLGARYEAFGEGPFEFIRIGGLAVTDGGQLVVVDPRQGRVTRFGPDLSPDTVMSPTPPPRGMVHAFGDGFVAATSGGARQTRLSVVSEDWAEVWSVPGPSPGSMSEYPYWGSIARTLVATGRDRIVLAYSFLYDLSIIDRSGLRADTVRVEAPGFRTARVPEAGEFSSVTGQVEMRRWLDSFDVISRIDVVADSLLVVTRGRIHGETGGQFRTEDTSLDVFRMDDLTPLWWDVALPAGSRVVGAGNRLHVLTSAAPEPLELTSYRFVGGGG